jgi:hypothetical protein
MSQKTKNKLEKVTPNQFKDPLFWRGYIFGVVFFGIFLFLHPNASAHIANIF